ncbi:MAG: hypothetical protein CMN30_14230 [Sandaracinus sp.]|nr:hypothetical protein [Sandaracinus sp.]
MTSVGALFLGTAVTYTVAAALYLPSLLRGPEGPARFASRVLMGAAGLHIAYLAVDTFGGTGAPMRGIEQTLTFLSLGIVMAFLLARLRGRGIDILGAFLTPVALLFLMGAGVGRSVGEVPHEIRSALLPFHIAVNMLGVVAFALAFGAASAYVIQERMLRRKKLGGIFQRLPPLDVLDTFGLRAVSLGFPLLTLGILTGVFWVDPVEHFDISPMHGFALAAWVLFAGVLLLRLAAGWRGRRAAIGTIMGFLCALGVLAGYVMRDSGIS